MSALQTLRHARILARIVLAWFVLSLTVAVAAPVVKPQALSVVCSAVGSVKLVAGGDEGSVPMQTHGLDCVLCLAVGAPPALATAHATLQPALSCSHTPADLVFVSWRISAPLPARGPPTA